MDASATFTISVARPAALTETSERFNVADMEYGEVHDFLDLPNDISWNNYYLYAIMPVVVSAALLSAYFRWRNSAGNVSEEKQKRVKNMERQVTLIGIGIGTLAAIACLCLQQQVIVPENCLEMFFPNYAEMLMSSTPPKDA